jgi:hypothetical protein
MFSISRFIFRKIQIIIFFTLFFHSIFIWVGHSILSLDFWKNGHFSRSLLIGLRGLLSHGLLSNLIDKILNRSSTLWVVLHVIIAKLNDVNCNISIVIILSKINNDYSHYPQLMIIRHHRPLHRLLHLFFTRLRH